MSDNDFPKYTLSPCGYFHNITMTVSQTIPPDGLNAHSAAVSTLGLYAPKSFHRYYKLWMVTDLNYLQSCDEIVFVPKLREIIVSLQNGVPQPILAMALQQTKPLVDSPFILNLDNLTCYQLNCFL